MTRAVLSIGSNQGDRLGYLQTALGVFRPWLVAVSPVFETPPWGPIVQESFLNAVLIVDDPAAEPPDWLSRAHEAETAAGRVREVRWGPRTLDVDVIAVDDVRSDDVELSLPHPRAHERAFVLVPWLAVQAEATLPEGRVADLIGQLDPDEVTAVIARPDLILG